MTLYRIFCSIFCLIFSTKLLAQDAAPSTQQGAASENGFYERWISKPLSSGLQFTTDGYRYLYEKSSVLSLDFGEELFEAIVSELTLEDAADLSSIVVSAITTGNSTLVVSYLSPLIKRSVPISYVLMGLMYKNGRGGVTANCSESVKWFRRALPKGNEVAMYQMGLAYINGCGVQQSLMQARMWLLLANKKGYRSAKIYLTEIEMKLSSADLNESLRLASICEANRYTSCED